MIFFYGRLNMNIRDKAELSGAITGLVFALFVVFIFCQFGKPR